MISTHATYKKLISGGFTEEQAEAVVEIVDNKQDSLVTTKDISYLKDHIATKEDMAIINTELKWHKLLLLSIAGMLAKVIIFGI